LSASAPTPVIDRVDDHDRPIGRLARKDALATGANFRTAHVFILDSANRLLLQQLADSRERHPLRWGSSVAAYVLSQETYRHAAERRMRQELGLALELHELGKISMRDERSTKFVFLFTARNGGAQVLEPDHIAAIRYWDQQELDLDTDRHPDRFTPTFLKLYRYFRRSDDHRASRRSA
jgi:isopentenyl-diphosphate Delta-isomerase